MSKDGDEDSHQENDFGILNEPVSILRVQIGMILASP